MKTIREKIEDILNKQKVTYEQVADALEALFEEEKKPKIKTKYKGFNFEFVNFKKKDAPAEDWEIELIEKYDWLMGEFGEYPRQMEGLIPFIKTLLAKERERFDNTQDGWCCACGADIALMNQKIEQARQEEREHRLAEFDKWCNQVCDDRLAKARQEERQRVVGEIEKFYVQSIMQTYSYLSWGDLEVLDRIKEKLKEL